MWKVYDIIIIGVWRQLENLLWCHQIKLSEPHFIHWELPHSPYFNNCQLTMLTPVKIEIIKRSQPLLFHVFSSLKTLHFLLFSFIAKNTIFHSQIFKLPNQKESFYWNSSSQSQRKKNCLSHCHDEHQRKFFANSTRTRVSQFFSTDTTWK